MEILRKIVLRWKVLGIVLVMVLGNSSVVSGQIPVVDVINSIIEGVENVLYSQELVQNTNENTTAKESVQNKRKMNLKLRKVNDLYRKINPIIENSNLNSDGIADIVHSISQDLSDYLDIATMDELGGYGNMSSQLSDISFEDWYQDLDMDIIEQLNQLNNIEDSNQLLAQLTQKKAAIEQFTKQYNIRAAVANYQLADEYEVKADELHDLINGTTIRSYSDDGLNFNLVSLLPDLSSLMPSSLNIAECNGIENDLSAVIAEIAMLTAEAEVALGDEDFEAYAEYVYELEMAGSQQEQIMHQMQLCDQADNLSNAEETLLETQEVIDDVIEIVETIMGDLTFMDPISETDEEAALLVNDAERLELMAKRDAYLEKAIDLRQSAGDLIHQASLQSEASKANLKKVNQQRWIKGISQFSGH